MNKSPLISVIIPIYNKELYLKECLDSVLSQSYKNIEVICIDDGSTDNSVSIVEDIINKDSRVKLFKIKHGGPSAARNIGIENAKGEYIHFVDADDYLKPFSYEIIAEKLNTHKCDVLLFYSEIFSSNNSISNKINKNNDYVNEFNNAQYVELNIKMNPRFIIEKACGGAVLWNKIFKREVIIKNNIKFDTRLWYFEDSDFYYKFIINSNKIIVLPFDFYLFRTNVDGQQTVTSAYKKDVLKLIFIVYQNSIDKYSKKSVFKKSFLNAINFLCFEHYKNIPVPETRLEAARDILNFIKNNNDSDYIENIKSRIDDIDLINYNCTAVSSNINYMKQNEVLNKLINDYKKQNEISVNAIKELNEKCQDLENKIQVEHNNYLNEIKTNCQIKNSTSYKVGRLIVNPFSKIRNFFKND